MEEKTNNKKGFTRVLKSKYIRQFGRFCPFCGIVDCNVALNEDLPNRLDINLHIQCTSCQKEWWEIYKLRDIKTEV